MTEIKQPKIRFKGHINNWEQRKLGEIVCISSGFTGDSSLNIGQYELTRIETIANGQVNINKIGYSNKEPDKKYLLDKGDILFSNINSLTHIGKVALFDLDMKLYHGINLLRLQPINVNSQFLYQSFKQNKHLEWAKSHANQAINQASINQTELSKQVFLLPSQQEQQKIGEFLKTLDETIVLHQQKLEVTKQFKQTMLKKMFPRNGQTKPEIRFKGFTDDWEECILGDKVIIERGNLPSKTSEIDGKYPFFNTGSKKLYSNKYNFDYQHQVIVSGHGSVGNISNAYGKVGVSDGCYVLTSDNLDMYFLFVISEKYLSNHLNKMKTGNIISHTSKSDVYNCKILCPKLNSEIYLISEYFRNLDCKITNLQNKITQYKKIKKAMLQKMFI